MTRIQRSIVYVFANYPTSFREEAAVVFSIIQFTLWFFFSHHQESKSKSLLVSVFPILLVYFSLGSIFIFIDNCFEINEMDHILNCGQRYESEHDPHS